MMKLLTILFLAFAVSGGCLKCKRDAVPPPPYGQPDDTITYRNGSYREVTYVYNCYQGKHRDVSYASWSDCDPWGTAEYVEQCSVIIPKQENSWEDCFDEEF